MKKNKIITWIVLGLILSGVMFFVYQYYFKEDSKSTLTLAEKEWIQSNKNKIIDFGITNDLAIFTKDGAGVFFDFLDDLEADTKLEFNKVPFNKGEKQDNEYQFHVVDKRDKNDILVYQDHYILLTKEKKAYSVARDLNGLTVGVLKDDLNEVNHYLTDRNTLSFQTYNDHTSLLEAINTNKVKAIAVPKMYYLNEISMNDKLNISYNINEMTKDYVISLGKTNKLNTILKKYFEKWKKEDYRESFDSHFASNYYGVRQIDEQAKSSFHSKQYIYGYVNNRPYNVNIDSKLYGYTFKQLKNFSEVAGIEIDYKEYPNNKELQDAFNTNKIDLFYNNVQDKKYALDTYLTIPVMEERIVIISPIRDNNIVNSINSLRGKEVLVVKDSDISKSLKDAKANVKEYATVADLINNRSEASLIALDYYNYEYYHHGELVDYKIDYVTSYPGNGYIIRDIKDNQVFSDYLNTYISIVNDPNAIQNSIYTILKIGNKPYIFKVLIYMVAIVICSVLGFFGYQKYQDYKKKPNMVSKTDKLRYIDDLTSLKNRTYLNDNIESWDNSEVYPQAILIIDLNNIAYINDNYGHQAGDDIIKEAANKLITNQIENTDIIRTNGNEFLIYMVGYEEKQVITYIKKLNKELKDLSHGYGAAIGYSMINDAIKTIDDAVNEATLDMRNNKEELNN